MSNPFPDQFQAITPEASDNLATRVAKLEARLGGQTPSLGPFLPTAGGAINGDLTVSGNITNLGFMESGGIFSHQVDSLTTTAPVTGQFYHETLTGTPGVGNGSSLDLQMDSATVKRREGVRFIASWLTATDATRTAQLRVFMPSSGTFTQVLQMSPTTLGFFGVAAVARPSVPDGSNLATVIDALQALGLFAP